MTTQSHDRTLSIGATPLIVRIGTIALAAGLLVLTAGARGQSPEAKAPTYTVLYSFTGGTDGAIPIGGNLILDAEGTLFGTTGWGGDLSCFDDNPPGCGVVFKVDKTGKETVLHKFTGGTDGILSFSGLVRDDAGNLYGNTSSGGTAGAGVVFKLDAARQETILYTFSGKADGRYPDYAVLRDDKGNLYGTTENGGDLSGCGGTGCGVVFKVEPSGKETVLYSFTGGTDGGVPNDLIQDENGTLYGTTSSGGDLSACGGSGCGVVFKVDKAGKETVLYRFTGGADGFAPYAGVVRDESGNLFGTTSSGGDLSGCGGSGCGTVFKLNTAGKKTDLYRFTGGADGGNPYSDLIRDAAGNLYSTAYTGGHLGCIGGSGCGVVFKVEPSGKETVLHTFTGGKDGGVSSDGLVSDGAGNLYGTTGYGGAFPEGCSGYGCGVVFKIGLQE